METELSEVADYAVEQPGVNGYLCVDKNGLCVAVKGQACESMSGIIHQLAQLASKIDEPNSRGEPPVIRVDLECYKILIQSREKFTTALFSPQR